MKTGKIYFVQIKKKTVLLKIRKYSCMNVNEGGMF